MLAHCSRCCGECRHITTAQKANTKLEHTNKSVALIRCKEEGNLHLHME
jgi:hypothetical protein